MAKTLKEMKAALLERTKKNYDRREPELGAKYIDKEQIGDMKLWRALPTKGNPHIVDIIPFEAGDKFPAQSDVEEGDAVYCLDLFVHPNVGPSKSSVICPAKNYGMPCPICDEVDELIKEGAEWNEIPFTPKRRVIYNVVVMDDAKTEALGVQLWDVSYKYFEEPVLGLSKSPRTGGVIAFAAPDKASGRSIAFDVANDTYKKITGHRFEERDYDISQEILDAAVQLDQIIIIHSEEEIKKILYGSSSKKEKDDPEDVGNYDDGEPENSGEPKEETKPESRKKTLKKNDDEKTCPNGAEYGLSFDEYQECEGCDIRIECSEAKAVMEAEKEKQEKEAEKSKVGKAPAAKRTLLRRR